MLNRQRALQGVTISGAGFHNAGAPDGGPNVETGGASLIPRRRPELSRAAESYQRVMGLGLASARKIWVPPPRSLGGGGRGIIVFAVLGGTGSRGSVPKIRGRGHYCEGYVPSGQLQLLHVLSSVSIGCWPAAADSQS